MKKKAMVKSKVTVIGAIIIVFLLPATLTYAFLTSTIVEDSVAKILTYTGKPTTTIKNLEKAEKNIKELNDLYYKKWAEINGKFEIMRLVEKKFKKEIKEAACKHEVKEELVKAITIVEWNPKKNKSKMGAIGPMGLMPATAVELGVNPYNDYENILGGTKYISKLLDRYDGNLKLALAAYNAGMGNVRKYKGIPPFEETKNYVGRVKYFLTQL